MTAALLMPPARKKSTSGDSPPKAGKRKAAKGHDRKHIEAALSPEELAERVKTLKTTVAKLPTSLELVKAGYGSDMHLGVTFTNHPLGVLFSFVEPDDLAWNFGVRPGDVLLKINDVSVTNHIEAVTALQKSSAMDPTILTYLKSSVAEAEMSKRRSLTRITTIDLCASNHVGLSLGNHPLGLLCIDVTPDEIAHKAGLRPGDVIVTLDGSVVTEHKDAVEYIKDRMEASHGAAGAVPLHLSYYSARAAAVELVVVSSRFGKSSSSTSRTARFSARGSTTNRPFTQRSRLEDATTSSTSTAKVEARFGPNATFGPTATTMPASAHERPANLPEGPREESLFVLPEGSLGLYLMAPPNWRDGAHVQVTYVELSSHAAEMGVVKGMEVLRVNGVSMAGKDHHFVGTEIKNAPRPLKIVLAKLKPEAAASSPAAVAVEKATASAVLAAANAAVPELPQVVMTKSDASDDAAVVEEIMYVDEDEEEGEAPAAKEEVLPVTGKAISTAHPDAPSPVPSPAKMKTMATFTPPPTSRMAR